MIKKPSILGICGSTRKQSTNLSLLKAIGAIAPERFSLQLFVGLSALPQFNPDMDTETALPVVKVFRDKVAGADGIIVCTPEYAMGVPGSLKNALDWVVSSSSFSGKPVMAITASLSGQKAHLSLLETLRVIEAVVPDELQLVIPFVKTKVDVSSDTITDAETLRQVQGLVDRFCAKVNL